MNTAANIFSCGGAGCNNTGTPNCQFKPGNITGLLLVPKNKTFTKTELETFDTVLKAASEVDSAAARIYPIKPFTGVESTSTEEVTSETGYGFTNFVRDGKVGMNFRLDLGHCSWKKMRGFHNKQSAWKVLLIDPTNNVIWGASNGTGGMTGFSLSMLSVKQFNLNDGS